MVKNNKAGTSSLFLFFCIFDTLSKCETTKKVIENGKLFQFSASLNQVQISKLCGPFHKFSPTLIRQMLECAVVCRNAFYHFNCSILRAYRPADINNSFSSMCHVHQGSSHFSSGCVHISFACLVSY